jgi:TRAF3-interacting protein 1
MGDEAGPPEWVVQTQATLGELIKRPKMTPALLQKPPFRFLHDIVSEVTKATGFADGLFGEHELNSGMIKVRLGPSAVLHSMLQAAAVGARLPP